MATPLERMAVSGDNITHLSQGCQSDSAVDTNAT